MIELTAIRRSGHIARLSCLEALVVHANRQLATVHLVRMHDLDGTFGIRNGAELNGTHAERFAIVLSFVDLTVDDGRVAHFFAEQILQLGPLHLVRYVRHEYGPIPAVLQVVFVVFNRRSVLRTGATTTAAATTTTTATTWRSRSTTTTASSTSRIRRVRSRPRT